MVRIPSVYSMVRSSTVKGRSYTADIGYRQSNVKNWSNKDLLEWLRLGHFDEKVIKRVKKTKLTGEELLTMTMDRLVSEYGVYKIGQQKRIMQLICPVDETDYSNSRSKSKSNSSIPTTGCIITVLHHRTADHTEGTVHKLLFSYIPTYRDFTLQINKELTNIKSVFYYDRQGVLQTIYNSETWYEYMTSREKDPSIMLEIDTYDYSLFDSMDAYILVVDAADTVQYCNSKLRTIVQCTLPCKLDTVVSEDCILTVDGRLRINSLHTVQFTSGRDRTVYIIT